MLCCLLEIGMMVAGIVAMVTGKLRLSSGTHFEGTAARWAGAILILPLPVAFGTGMVIGFVMAAQGKDPGALKENQAMLSIMEGIIVLGCLIGAIVVGSIAQKNAKPPAPNPFDTPDQDPYQRDRALDPFRASDPRDPPPPPPEDRYRI